MTPQEQYPDLLTIDDVLKAMAVVKSKTSYGWQYDRLEIELKALINQRKSLQPPAPAQGVEEAAKEYATTGSVKEFVESGFDRSAYGRTIRAFIAGSRWQQGQGASNGDWQRQYSDLLEWTVMLVGPLKELVELKQIKDEQGKTSEYEERQPKAWHMARTAIAMWEERGNYGLKLKHEIPHPCGARWLRRSEKDPDFSVENRIVTRVKARYGYLYLQLFKDELGAIRFEGRPNNIVYGDFEYLDESPCTCQSELNELREWKRRAMKVTPDFQAIGKELGIPLAQSVHDKILPAIRKLKAELPALPTREEAIDWVINKYGPGPVDVRVKLACISFFDWLIGQCGTGSVDLVELAFRRGHQLGYQANQIGESNYENACWEAFKSSHSL